MSIAQGLEARASLSFGNFKHMEQCLTVPTPWNQLNSYLSGGLVGGELIVVSGNGLSNALNVFVRSIVLHAAEQRTKTIYANARGSEFALVEQFIMWHVPVERQNLRLDKFSAQERLRIDAAKQTALTLPLTHRRYPICIDELEIFSSSFECRGEIFIVIDPVCMIHPNNGDFSEMIARLKWLAAKNSIPVLISLENYEVKKDELVLDDFHESIRTHADKLITISEKAVYDNVLHVAVIRNREGDIGSVVLSYDASRSALIEGDYLVPEHIHEPMSATKHRNEPVDDKTILQRFTPLLKIIAEKITKDNSLLENERAAALFVIARTSCKTHMEALQKIDKAPEQISAANSKGSRYKATFKKIVEQRNPPQEFDVVEKVLKALHA